VKWRNPVIWFLFGLIVGLLLGSQPFVHGQTSATHVIVVSPRANMKSVQDWMARRGIAARTVGTMLAAPLSEADVEALAERDDVLQVRAPLPSELVAEPVSAQQRLPIVQADGATP